MGTLLAKRNAEDVSWEKGGHTGTLLAKRSVLPPSGSATAGGDAAPEDQRSISALHQGSACPAWRMPAWKRVLCVVRDPSCLPSRRGVLTCTPSIPPAKAGLTPAGADGNQQQGQEQRRAHGGVLRLLTQQSPKQLEEWWLRLRSTLNARPARASLGGSARNAFPVTPSVAPTTASLNASALTELGRRLRREKTVHERGQLDWSAGARRSLPSDTPPACQARLPPTARPTIRGCGVALRRPLRTENRSWLHLHPSLHREGPDPHHPSRWALPQSE